MDAIGIIPARFKSSRLEGKVLADICGKPMIQHVWERAKQAKLLEDLIVACDDEKIVEVVRGFGGKAVLTSKGHICGTDRIIEVVSDLEVKVVVNIQADEPLLHPKMVDDLVRALLEDKKLMVATLAKKIEEEKESIDPNVVKVVFDNDNFALYFSRSSIPYARDAGDSPLRYKHIGLYAYRRDFLFIYKNMAPSSLEGMEKLEQLRILENGYRIKVIETKFETMGVDTSEDLEKVRSISKQNPKS